MPFILLSLLFIPLTLAQSYTLEIFINDTPVPYLVETGSFESGYIILSFEGGKLELNLSDWNTFEYAHVLATTFNKTRDTYTVSATIRHKDTGWDNYADAFEVKGETVQNGLRVLTHPHENEQPFTRSQTDVVAQGLVWVEAKDNVEGLRGNKIHLDLSHPSFVGQNNISIRYTIQ